WDFDAKKKIRYRTDDEYEQHFRTVFFNAVRRSLRSDAPVLAELSGGRDSSSIVCVADKILACEAAETPALDTISWYDDSEPNWNDRPYLTKVEEKRGRSGWHIDLGLQYPKESFERELPNLPVAPVPVFDGRILQQIRLCLMSQGNRVVLSGIGGDEVMGGVPVPTAELQDLLRMAKFASLARQLQAWALQKKKPLLSLLLEAVQGF